MHLSYSDDRVLQLKAEVALARYPRLAREVLLLYGPDQAFKSALRSFGEVVLLPIAYYLKNDSLSLSLARRAEEAGDLIKDKARQLASTVKRYADVHNNDAAPKPIEPAVTGVPPEVMQSEREKNTRENAEPETPARISPEERGQYAIALIERHGFNFLGQFVLDEYGEPRRLYTEAALEDVGSFFAGGIRTLESKAKADQAITAGDVGWAAIDALAVVGAAKLPRLAKALAVSEKGASVATRGGGVGIANHPDRAHN
jgi:hypothetical protein